MNNKFVDHAMETAKYIPQEDIIARISQREFIDCWFRALKDRLESGDRSSMHAVRLVAELHKMVGTQRELALLVVERFGAPEESIKDAVEAMKALNQMDDGEKFDECVRYLCKHVQRDPSLRMRLSPLMSGAEIVNGNGNGNGKHA